MRDLEATVNATCCGQPVLIQWIESLEVCPHCDGNMMQDQASAVATTMHQESRVEQVEQPTDQAREPDNQQGMCEICCEERSNWMHGPCAHKVCTDCGPKLLSREYRDGRLCSVIKCPFCRTDWTVRYQ